MRLWSRVERSMLFNRYGDFIRRDHSTEADGGKSGFVNDNPGRASGSRSVELKEGLAQYRANGCLSLGRKSPSQLACVPFEVHGRSYRYIVMEDAVVWTWRRTP